MDKLNVDAWVGREVIASGSISDRQAQMIAATIGGAAPIDVTDPLPPLWHWYAFTPIESNAALGPDGHVRGSSLLPPIHLKRRMWAGGGLTFHRPVHAGERLQRSTRVRSIVEKQGKSGPMVFVTLDHLIFGAHGLAVEERQDIVYLDIPDTFMPPAKQALPVPLCERVDMPETVLFRYSAITFNAHRIHYDLRYTQEVEKYPGLLVHGPLQAALLMRAAVRHRERAPLFFEFRAMHPMFVGSTCDIAMQESTEGLSLWTGQDGHQCMQAQAVWEETQ